MTIIPGLHANIFSVTRALQKGFQVKSKGETLIFKKKSTNICFEKKISNNSGKGFLLTIKLYKSKNNAAIPPPENKNPEGKAAAHPEETAIKKQENKTTKKL